MPLEIDFLAVGDANAIIIRTTDQLREQVVVVDGGNSDDGNKVVRHINQWTRRRDCVDLLINTHPDADHVDGLLTIVNHLRIGEVWIHDPDAHQFNVKSLIRGLQFSPFSRVQEAAKSLDTATQVIDLIRGNRITYREPFAGCSYQMLDDTCLTVLGPTQELYTELLMRMIRDAQKSIIEEASSREIASLKSLRSARDLLDADNDRTPSNNSSVIFTVSHKGDKFLFTGDAGPMALEHAQQFAPALMRDVAVLQVPHHGSRKSLTSELVDFINPELAVISAAGTDRHHPDQVVVKVLYENGCRVYCTMNNGTLLFSLPDTRRGGYSPATPLTPSDLS